jgi:L-iditol 2-dehydrogenase
MKVMELTGIREMAMMEIAKPAIVRDTDVLIKMVRVGVCGSDVHYYTDGAIGTQVVKYPFAVGHEGAGIVQEVGAGVTRVKPGDRIAFDPAMPCGKCAQCKAGRFHTCLSLKFLGCPGQAEGCLSDYLVIPEGSCFPIPESLTFDEAAAVEPLSIGVYAAKLAGDLRGKALGILGSGPIGLSVLLAAKAQGAARVFMTDKIDARLDVARRAGADWVGNPLSEDVVAAVKGREPESLDIVFECAGKQEAIDQSLHFLKPGGKLMLIGIPGASNRVSFDINILRHKEICIQNVRRQNECVQEAIDMVAGKQIDVDVMITHHFQFPQTKEAFDLVAGYRDGVVKAMIEFE